MRALRRLVAERGVDVVHGYEWTTALEAYFGPRARDGVPAVATVMSMAVAPFLPLDMPLVVGTEQIADHERRLGRSPSRSSSRRSTSSRTRAARSTPTPSAASTGSTRTPSRWCPSAGWPRSSSSRACSPASRSPGGSTAMQLVIAGDGPSRDEVDAAVERANAAAGPAARWC